jgi:hypothetical protein
MTVHRHNTVDFSVSFGGRNPQRTSFRTNRDSSDRSFKVYGGKDTTCSSSNRGTDVVPTLNEALADDSSSVVDEYSINLI